MKRRSDEATKRRRGNDHRRAVGWALPTILIACVPLLCEQCAHAQTLTPPVPQASLPAPLAPGPAALSLAAQLNALPPLPKPTMSAPWPAEALSDPVLAKALVRTLGTATVNMRWATNRRLVKARDLNAPLTVLYWCAYHDPFNGYPAWRKGPDGDWNVIDQRLFDYYAYFLGKCRAAKEILGDRQVLIFFEHEMRWPHEPEVDMLLNQMVLIARSVFTNSQVAFLNWGQWAPGPGARPWTEHAPISKNVLSDYAGVMMYYTPGSYQNRVRLEQTAARTEKPLIASITIGSMFRETPYTPMGENRRVWCNRCPPQIGQTWGLANWLYGDFAAGHPQAFGPVGRVAIVKIWPPVMDPNVPHQVAHLIAFVKGASGIRAARLP